MLTTVYPTFLCFIFLTDMDFSETIYVSLDVYYTSGLLPRLETYHRQIEAISLLFIVSHTITVLFGMYYFQFYRL